MGNYIEKFRNYAKSIPITFESWMVSFVAIILIRIFLEQFSSFSKERFILIDLPTIVHYGVFYLAVTVSLMVILLFFSKTDLKEILGVGLLGTVIIWIAPIIDLLWKGIGGYQMGYIFAEWNDLFFRFLTFFGGHINSEITLGIQIELLMGIVFCYLYVWNITKSVGRSVGAAFAFYCFIFFIVSTPSLLALLFTSQPSLLGIVQSVASSSIVKNNIHPSFSSTVLGLFDLGFNKTMMGINMIITVVFSTFLFFMGIKNKFIALIKNSRPERIFHFFLLFLFGSSLVQTKWFINWIDAQSYILAFMAFVFAWMFSVCQNDIYDEKIDSVANKERPLVSKELNEKDLQIASKIFLLFFFISAYASGGYVLFFAILFLLVYFIYSNPPFRLKRFVLVNSGLVGIACLSVILAGFFLVNQEKSILSFPPNLVFSIVVFFTIVSNIRDIKDVEGDRVDGIKTIPVILGVKKSKKIIAGAVCFFFLLIPWYFDITNLFIPSIIASILSWYFINEDNYKEWKAFVVYMLYLILIIYTFIFK